MMYDIDILKFVKKLIPPFLRKPKRMYWLVSLLQPVKVLLDNLKQYREEKLVQISYTGQTLQLERLLNDAFDSGSRRIRVLHDNSEDGYDYFASEGQTPDYDYFASEGAAARYMYFAGEQTSAIAADFAVEIPSELNSYTNQIAATVNKYRLASRTFEIQEV